MISCTRMIAQKTLAKYKSSSFIIVSNIVTGDT